MENKQKMIEHLVREIWSHFSRDEVMFGVLFGSWARNENRDNSDIDLMIVFRNRVLPIQKINKFKEAFIELQQSYSLFYDRDYPGEYVSIFDIKNANKGQGFIRDQKAIQIDPINSTQWTNFNSSRQWLSAMAGPNCLLTGDKQEFEDLSIQSLSTIFLLVALTFDKNLFFADKLVEHLLKGGKEYLGFCNTKNTQKYLLSQFPSVCQKLAGRGLTEPSSSDSLLIKRNKAFESLPRIIDKSYFEFSKKFLGSTTTKEEKETLQKSLEIGLDFILDFEKKTLNYHPEDSIRDRFHDSIPEFGKSLDKIIVEFQKKIIDGSIHQASPNYLAFPDSGNSLAAITADILISFLNQNLISTTKSAPTGTFLEMQVIQWLRKMIGYSDSEELPENALQAGGIMTSGGTLANTTALLVARCKTFPESRKQGLQTLNVKPILIIAADTLYHYSHIAAFWWLGLGEENIVFVKARTDFRLDCDDLDKKLTEYNNHVTSKVVAVVAQAGDSRTTTIEDFNKVVGITKKHQVWLHVDACHGGVLLLSEKYRDNMQGVEQANSISIDPHKGLGIPYPSSAVLFRDIKDCELISKSTDITIQNGSSDLGQITPFSGSRAFDSLKLWFLIKHLGTKGIGDLVDYRYGLAEKWADGIKGSRFFEPLNEVKLNSVVFSISPSKVLKNYRQSLNSNNICNINKLIHDIAYKEGYICIHSFDIVDMASKITSKKEKLRVLGVTIGNPHTLAVDFPDYIEYLDTKAEEILKNYDNNNHIPQ